MKIAPLMLVLFLVSCGSIATNSAEPKADISYKLEMMLQPFPMIKVEMSFQGDEDGITEIDLPDHWASQKNYYNGIKNIQLINKNAELISTKYNNVYEIKHQPSEIITLSYYVIQDFTESITHKNYYRPIIQENYFHIIGHGMFIQPKWDEDKTYSISFSWKLPKHWAIANSHSAEKLKHQNEIQLGNLRQAVYLGGDFKIEKLFIAEQPLYVASRSEWQFKLQDYYQLIEKIVKNERGFFNDFAYPHYLISMIPTSEPCCSSGGTGLINSFATFISNDLPNINTFKHLLSHELFHNWNGRVIGRADPEEIYYWFTEGFTDYYTRLLNLRGGIIDLDEYFEDFNRVYRNYYLSPARNKTNQDVKQQFWSNRDIGKIPYLRGDVLAHYWNQIIKTSGTDSVDSMMKDLYRSATENGTVISNESLHQHFLPYLTDGIEADIKKYLEEGATVALKGDSLGICGSLIETESYPFDLGFDFQNSQKNRIVIGVKKVSSAYRAGLRNGQKMGGWSIHNGNIEKSVSITILLEDSSRKQIVYLPKGEKLMIPQFKFNKEIWKKDPQKCMAWFNP